MKLLRFSTRALSALVGAFAQIPLPVFLRRALFLLYSRFYSVRLEDCVSPPEAYPSLLSFFLRDVRDRKIEDGVVSPADGLITEAGEIVSGRLFQAKGRSYTLSELLADGSLAAEFEGGWYLTIYLAPGDYHHVHAPISGSIREVRSISGLSLPVNGWSVRMFERVFPRNERVVLRIADSSGREYLLVMVGALNVGSLRLSYPGLLPEVSLEELFYSRGVEVVSPPQWEVRPGDRLGSFCLGSTVIFILPPGERSAKGPGSVVRFGESLGVCGREDSSS